MEISPRNRTRLLALGAAALIIGIGWWLTHRGTSTSTSTAAPADTLTPAGGTNTTTTTQNSGPVNGGSSTSTSTKTAPTNNGADTNTIYGAPTYTDYTSYAAPHQSNFSTAAKAQTANPLAPAGHQQPDALQQLGGFFGGIGNAGEWILPGAGYVAGPAIAIGTNEIGWIGQQLPGIGGAYNATQSRFNSWAGGLLSPIFGGAPAPKKAAAAPAPANPFISHGSIQPATAASQLAHRGLPAPKASISAPAPAPTVNHGRRSMPQ